MLSFFILPRKKKEKKEKGEGRADSFSAFSVSPRKKGREEKKEGEGRRRGGSHKVGNAASSRPSPSQSTCAGGKEEKGKGGKREIRHVQAPGPFSPLSPFSLINGGEEEKKEKRKRRIRRESRRSKACAPRAICLPSSYCPDYWGRKRREKKIRVLP